CAELFFISYNILTSSLHCFTIVKYRKKKEIKGEEEMEWVVIVSVLVMTILSLLRVNVIVAIILAAVTAGLMSGYGLVDSISMFVGGMGDQAETALSYILLGAFAVAISYTGITTILVNYLIRILTGRKTMMLLAIAGVASLSQNAVPVHIAFVPILIPPLLKLFDKMRVDRRGVAVALTFGLKTPYVMLPIGFGLIFHKTVIDSMAQNGVDVTTGDTTLALLLPGIGMIIGLLIAIFITYRKDRDARPGAGGVPTLTMDEEEKEVAFNKDHLFTIIAIVIALIVQLWTSSLIAGA